MALNGNPLGDAGCESIAKMLLRTGLQDIGLGNTGIANVGMLAEALAKSQTVGTISLGLSIRRITVVCRGELD